MSRAAETLSNIPLATLSIMALCIAVYLYQMAFDPILQEFTMCPRLVLYLHEYYRFITAALFHGSLMHIGMNMMSTVAIGTSLEKRLGTLTIGLTILWGILLTASIYTFVSWLLYVTVGYEKMMYQHCLGFSGVIFQLSVLESNLSPNRLRSVFGVFQVSSQFENVSLGPVGRSAIRHATHIFPRTFVGHTAWYITTAWSVGHNLSFRFISSTFRNMGCIRNNNIKAWVCQNARDGVSAEEFE